MASVSTERKPQNITNTIAFAHVKVLIKHQILINRREKFKKKTIIDVFFFFLIITFMGCAFSINSSIFFNKSSIVLNECQTYNLSCFSKLLSFSLTRRYTLLRVYESSLSQLSGTY